VSRSFREWQKDESNFRRVQHFILHMRRDVNFNLGIDKPAILVIMNNIFIFIIVKW